ncbi:MAG: thiamine pyrophosphate-binding protein [Candidatus Melainabacteria bacterium]|nr:thiamine pyrophosphate-binding protein [Candidatus Melainabacteria bacterium]
MVSSMLSSGGSRASGNGKSLIQAKHAFFQQLICDNIRLMFGNPGTVEEGILDTLADYPEIQYVMGLQEAAVTAMADAYARATKRPAFVQVHASVGLGNAMGILYQAKQCYTPLVVYAGETYGDLLDFYGFLGGDTVAIAKPVTKWSDRCNHGSQLLRNIRRAIKIAMTPPQGPVFLAIPMNVLEKEIEPDIQPTTIIDYQSRPSHEVLIDMADMLIAADSPMLFIGDGVHLSEGQQAVSQLAHLLGAPMYGVDFGNLSASFKDPLFLGITGHLYGEETQKITLRGDTLVALGTPLFPELFPSHRPYFRDDAKVIQVGLNDWDLAKNFPVDVALMAEPRSVAEALLAVITQRADDRFHERAAERREQWIAEKQATHESKTIRFQQSFGKTPMSPQEAMKVVAEALPQDVVVFDEAITSTGYFIHYRQPSQLDNYYMFRGGCLGMGIPGAIGLKYAYPDKISVALVGDGASLYTFQGLWTAAHYNHHVIYIICNNKTYRILKANLIQYWERHGYEPRPFHNMDITQPEVDFVKLAESFGVKGWRATDPASLRAAILGALADPRPHLIDMHIDGDVSTADKPLV